jgi:cell division protein FtsA
VEGLVELAEEIFHMPVRLGVPHTVAGLNDVIRNPAYATGVGLLLHGRQHLFSGERPMSGGGGFRSIWLRMKNWFQGNF